MLYNILIRPIEYIIEVFFVVLYRFLGNEGRALIGLSIVISTLVLPLYARAEAIQEQERKKQKEMEHWLQHIRSVFCGDERYMIQNAYYQEQGYKPFYALKGTLSLLLQVPFFMAAYHFLSHLQMLQGCSFGMISDLGMEDGMLVINSYRVNILPILMTLINFVSSAIYTREYNWKQKLQPYVLAVVFLILLYRSPAGLVLYWTMNNVYSLIKNLVMGNERLKHKVFIGCSLVLVSCFVILLFVTGRVDHMIKGRKFEDAFIYGMVLLLFAMPVIKCFFPRKPKEIMLSSGTKTVFWGSILLLILLLGVAIPLTIIASAPEDFLLVDRTYSPLKYLVYTLSVSLGLFGFWGGVFFCMQKPEVKARFADVIFALGLYSVVNALFFQSFVGNITTV